LVQISGERWQIERGEPFGKIGREVNEKEDDDEKEDDLWGVWYT
jgi:hypothetical protein